MLVITFRTALSLCSRFLPEVDSGRQRPHIIRTRRQVQYLMTTEVQQASSVWLVT